MAAWVAEKARTHGGRRSVQATKPMLAALKMVPIVETVPLPFLAQMVDNSTGALAPGEAKEKAAGVMLDELARWQAALRALRPTKS